VPDLGFDLDAAQVVRVTSLEVKGRGTLRDALKVKGPRLIVFEVGGVIDLQQQGIDVDEPEVIIAGQTAPAPGITLIRGVACASAATAWRCSNVVLFGEKTKKAPQLWASSGSGVGERRAELLSQPDPPGQVSRRDGEIRRGDDHVSFDEDRPEHVRGSDIRSCKTQPSDARMLRRECGPGVFVVSEPAP
jgi:hypothetical protein